MGILADSAIVGAATFLVGSLLMEFHVGKSGLERTPTASNISKIGLWPYIGTFIAGSVGFFLVTKSKLVEVKDAEEGEPCPNCKCSHENLEMTDSYNEGGMFWIDMVCQDCGLKGGSYTDDVQWEDEGILQSSPQIAYNTGNPNFGALKCPRCFKRFEKAAESFSADANECEGQEDWYGLELTDRWLMNDWYGWTYEDNDGTLIYIDGPEGSIYRGDRKDITLDEAKAYLNRKGIPFGRVYRSGDYDSVQFTHPKEECYKHDWSEDYYIEDARYEDDGTGGVVFRQRCNYVLCDTEREGHVGSKVAWNMAAESFSAEYLDGRKIRRRSRLSWTKGLEHDVMAESLLNSTLEYWNHHINQPDTSIAPSNAYYIDELPPGYHIHLWRPSKRSGYWRAYAKSPNNTAWKRFTTDQKSQITQQILDWYNTSVGIPEDRTDLTPIQIMMLKAGLISDIPMISRTEIKGYERKRFQDGRQVVVETIPKETQWYAHGGPEKIPMHKIASLRGDTLKIFPKQSSGKYAFADNFLRGLVFLDDAKRVGKESSVAKYNKDSKKWVSLYPAWFQNACANNVKNFKIEWFSWDGGVFYINDEKFLQFDNLDMVYSPFKWFDNANIKIVSPTIQKMMWDKAQSEIEIYQARPLRKLENIKLLQWSIFAQCVDKYQPQKFSETTKGMYSWDETDFKITELWPCPQFLSRAKPSKASYIESAAHMFLRRLGKKK